MSCGSFKPGVGRQSGEIAEPKGNLLPGLRWRIAPNEALLPCLPPLAYGRDVTISLSQADDRKLQHVGNN